MVFLDVKVSTIFLGRRMSLLGISAGISTFEGRAEGFIFLVVAESQTSESRCYLHVSI